MPEDRFTFPDPGPPNDPKIEVLKNGRAIGVIRKVEDAVANAFSGPDDWTWTSCPRQSSALPMVNSVTDSADARCL